LPIRALVLERRECPRGPLISLEFLAFSTITHVVNNARSKVAISGSGWAFLLPENKPIAGKTLERGEQAKPPRIDAGAVWAAGIRHEQQQYQQRIGSSTRRFGFSRRRTSVRYLHSLPGRCGNGFERGELRQNNGLDR
jgi:hypothetical protein